MRTDLCRFRWSWKAGRAESYFQADLLNNAGTVWRRTTKFSRITRGEGVYLVGQPCPCHKGAGSQRSPILGAPFYLCTHPLTQNYQILHVNTHMEELVLEGQRSSIASLDRTQSYPANLRFPEYSPVGPYVRAVNVLYWTTKTRVILRWVDLIVAWLQSPDAVDQSRCSVENRHVVDTTTWHHCRSSFTGCPYQNEWFSNFASFSHGLSPEYLLGDFRLVSQIHSRRRLHSASNTDVLVPATRRSSLGLRAFPVG